MCTFSTSERQKVVRPVSFFYTFDFQMCFASQGRALFRHLNFQKWSDVGVFWKFWLGNVLPAKTACTFSTSQLPKVVREWCALCIFTSKCASRHNGVHFFDLSTSKIAPKVKCFVHFDLEMCFAPQQFAIFSSLIWPAGSAPAALPRLLFDPPEPQIIGKTQWIVTFLPFRAPASSFFSDLLTSFLLLSDSSHLCFSNCPYCRKFDF